MARRKNAWISGLFLIVTLVVNGLGAAGFINGMSQKVISDKYLTLITPSPATFSIWSLIYILLFASLIVMIVKKKDNYYNKAIDEITHLFWLSCIFNIIWIVMFSYLFVELSSLFIFSFLVTLSMIGVKLRKIHEKKRILLPLTFGLYTGWLMIATVVNISAALVKMEWDGFGIDIEILASATLIVALLLVYLVLQSNKNVVFPLPVAWAYWGINAFLKSKEGFDGAYPMLEFITLLGVAVLIAFSALQFYKNKYEIIVSNSNNELI